MKKRTDIKVMAHKAGLTILELAEGLNMAYGTLAGKLNGFSPLREFEEEKILEIIKEKNIANR